MCDKNTTQDVVVIKMQHTISGSESRNVTQDIVMQFWNVVNMQHFYKAQNEHIIIGIYKNYVDPINCCGNLHL